MECGLKYKLLNKWGVADPRKILEGANDKKIKVLKSHNLGTILKELGQQGGLNFRD